MPDNTPETQELLPVTAIASLWTEMSARANRETDDEADDAHAVGFRDGFEVAVQKLDELTGGDGEYRFSTDPERNCPTPVEMIANIVQRHRISHSLPGDETQRAALERLSKLTPFSANAATAEDFAATVHAIADSALTTPPTPDRIGKDAVRERVGILEAALWSVLSYDQLLRQYSGPQAILFAGDVANIDATYDAMVAKVTAALSATPTQPVDETERWRPIETCPQEDLFIGAVHVRDNRSGAEWWERHLLALDDETGEIHADYEQGWELSAYSWWLPFSTPPIPATDKGEAK